MDNLHDTEFLFVPFLLSEPSEYESCIEEMENSPFFQLKNIDAKYLLKYISGKYRDNSRCVNCEIHSQVWKELGLADVLTFRRNISVNLISIHLYLFCTGIGIVVFQLSLNKSSLMEIATDEFTIKRVSNLYRTADGRESSFLQAAENIISHFCLPTKFQIFFFANEKWERANILTYIEAESGKEYTKELYYLSNCYSSSYPYTDNSKRDDAEVFEASNCLWGVTNEAVVCLYRKRPKDTFIKEFYKNFTSQYLFMYVLLLHQKYTLYMFQTLVETGAANNLDVLEEYRSRLFAFDADFAFSTVTEVPQYQNLYDAVYKAFRLSSMFEEVKGPLSALHELRREKEEREEQKRNKNTENSLAALSFLSVFSALLDCYVLIDSLFSESWSWSLKNIAQIIFCLWILLIFIMVLMRILKK